MIENPFFYFFFMKIEGLGASRELRLRMQTNFFFHK
nr:MAG TPA: hypothetical protein [Caudoviricetes sp.]